VDKLDYANRVIVGDTETTGLFSATDRITEVGFMEVIDFKSTGKFFHSYIYSGKKIPDRVVELTGITNSFLEGKPEFKTIAPLMMNFIGDSKMVFHNADFDMGFINSELRKCLLPEYPNDRFIDTLKIAREKFAGRKNSLDALCSRFGISLSGRELHGAIVDTGLLCGVYKELCLEKPDLFNGDGIEKKSETVSKFIYNAPKRPTPLPSLITDDERNNHNRFINEMESEGNRMLWWRHLDKDKIKLDTE